MDPVVKQMKDLYIKEGPENFQTWLWISYRAGFINTHQLLGLCVQIMEDFKGQLEELEQLNFERVANDQA